MDFTTKTFLLIECYQSCTLGTQVRIIIGAVKQIVYTALCGNGSKKSTHTY